MRASLRGWSATCDPATAAVPDFVQRLRADPTGLEADLRRVLASSGREQRTHPITGTRTELALTVLSNMIVIDASAARVWQALSDLTRLERYDPGVKASVLVGDLDAGVGAQRRCELRPHGWFIEEVTTWQPTDGWRSSW